MISMINKLLKESARRNTVTRDFNGDLMIPTREGRGSNPGVTFFHFVFPFILNVYVVYFSSVFQY
jgi:hypothetical protein